MKLTVLMLSIVSALITFNTPAFAAAPPPLQAGQQQKWTIGLPPVEDAARVAGASTEQFTGKITTVEEGVATDEWVRIGVKKDDGQDVTVWLGPAWFVKNQRMKMNVGEDVEVRGRKFNDNSYVATEISNATMTLRLRNEEDGIPSWECCIPRKPPQVN